MHATVALLFFEARVVSEGVLVAMLKDKVAARMEDVLGENLVRNGLQALEGIRRISENDIELLVADGEEIEDIVPDHHYIIKSEPLGLPLDERGIFPCHLNRIYLGSPPGSELESHRTGAAEKIQDLQILELIFIIKYIEESLTGEVGRRTGFVTSRRIDAFAFHAAADDPHIFSTDLK